MSRILQIEKELSRFLSEMPVGVTPGLQIQALQKGQRILDTRVGDTYSYYDLASLTKPLFTAMACAWAVDQGKLDIETPVTHFLPEFPYAEAKVKNLLNHTSGLPAYHEFFSQVPPVSSSERWSDFFNYIYVQPKADHNHAIYSDLGFMCLKPILEQVYQKPLAEIWTDIQNIFYSHIEGLHFCQENQPEHQVDLYAPTARCPWREKLIRGEVHDENAWLVGGMATHAGLFGSIDDVVWASLVVRAQMVGMGRKILKSKTSQTFFNRSIPAERGDWSLGFMLPTKNNSSAGQYFSSNSVGHLGFTGVSFWFDPEQDLVVVILSNRVFYSRENKEFHQWRPKIHDKIVELMRRY